MTHVVVSILLWASIFLTALLFVLPVWVVARRRTLELKEALFVLFIGILAVVVNGIAYTGFDRQAIGDLQWAATGALQLVTVLALGLNFVVAIALRKYQPNSTHGPTTDD